MKQDCRALARQHQGQFFKWQDYYTNQLPASLGLLKPQRVRFYPVEFTRREEPAIPTVEIKIFGMHSTGGRGIPGYELVVFCEPNTNRTRPMRSGPMGVVREIDPEIFERW